MSVDKFVDYLEDIMIEIGEETDEKENGMEHFGVYAEYNYYQGTLNAPQDGYFCNHHGHMMVFRSAELAEKWAEYLTPKGGYYLSHGQAGRPNYEAHLLGAPDLKKSHVIVSQTPEEYYLNDLC